MGLRTARIRIVVCAGVLGALVLTLFATGSLPSAGEVRDFGERFGAWAYLAYVPLFVLASFLITWPILAGAGGLLFGTAAGTPLTLVALTAASLAEMAVSRRLAAGHQGGFLPQRTRSLESFLVRNGTLAVMESRIVPALPFALVNYTAGLTRLPFRDMAVGTAVGTAPKVFAYTALGGSLGNLSSPEAIVALMVLLVLALTGVLLVRRQLTAERGVTS
jgi:uncharacterized membrane protein YdjX (TVP38/TMEM64 family)